MHFIFRITRLFFFLIANITIATSQNISLKSITPEEGLSNVSVNDLYQDERNYIWIATRDGLNCYNGSTITVYNKEKDSETSLLSNKISKITGNQNGKVYIHCIEGLVEYNIDLEKFEVLIESRDIAAIAYHDALIVAHDKELLIYDEEKEKFELLFKINNPNYTINSIFVDKKGTMYLGTNANGVLSIDKDDGQINQIINRGRITGIYEDSGGDIWIGSWDDGLFRIKDKDIVNYKHINNDSNSIQSNFVRDICEDAVGDIWVGTFLGLNKFDKDTESFNYYDITNDYDKLTSSSIWRIIKDHQGTLWMGTYFGGVIYFNPEYEIYTHYPISNDKGKGLSHSVVGNIIEDKLNNLWICTEGGGLNVYNKDKKTYKWYKHDENNPNSISHNNIISIYYDEKKDIMWIGTHLGGLNKLDLTTNKFTNYTSIDGNSNSLPSNIIKHIIPYEDKLLLATYNGVAMFDPTTGTSELLFQNDKLGYLFETIYYLLIDSEGILWISVWGEGIFQYNFETNILNKFEKDTNSISNRNVYNIIEDDDNNIWLSTSDSGLLEYRRGENKIYEHNTENSDIISNYIYEVVQDGADRLLLISSQGFSVYDKSLNKFTNYNKYNGFPLTVINEYGLYLSNSGEVYLGGVKGMISFKIDSLNIKKKPYDINFTHLYANNKEIKVGDDTGILQKTLSKTENIILKNRYSVLGIEFASTNYILANKDDIIYQLEGFSDEWINTNEHNRITYTNLKAGNYLLIVKNKASQDDYAYFAKLNIKVLPPFYKSGMAYIIYALIILISLFTIIRTYKERIKLKTALKYEQKHIRDVEELNQTKLKFFTNISHEFRTPITLIMGQTEVLLQAPNIPPAIYNKVLQIYKSSTLLKDLIAELLDFKKQEEGLMSIKVSKHDLVDFLHENYSYFLEYASLRQINFNFVKEISTIDVWFDSKQMQKVINNLLSNAFKHTHEEGAITITVRKTDDCAIIEVKDSGSGISNSELSKIFDRFYQTDQLNSMNMGTGTGIGLALTKGIIELHHGTIEVKSEEGEGTLFSIYLQLGNKHFSPSQIAEDENAIEQINIDKRNRELLLEAEGLSNISPTSLNFENEATILIVEDNKSIRDMLTYLFQPYYTILTANDGEEGLSIANDKMPDIILSDVVMPKMTGTELCKAIKNDINLSHIPVVLLTAKTAIEHNLEGLKIGADDYITKPFNTSILVSRCNNLVNNRIMLKEKFSKQPSVDAKILATNPLDKELMDKIISIIDKYMDDNQFTVDKLAEEMGMSRTVLYKKFKGISGKTPNEFIRIIRLRKAAFLLKNNPEYNISDISYMTGFSTLRYFSQSFKNHYDVSPSEYRSEDIQEDNKDVID